MLETCMGWAVGGLECSGQDFSQNFLGKIWLTGNGVLEQRTLVGMEIFVLLSYRTLISSSCSKMMGFRNKTWL